MSHWLFSICQSAVVLLFLFTTQMAKPWNVSSVHVSIAAVPDDEGEYSSMECILICLFYRSLINLILPIVQCDRFVGGGLLISEERTLIAGPLFLIPFVRPHTHLPSIAIADSLDLPQHRSQCGEGANGVCGPLHEQPTRTAGGVERGNRRY